MKSVILMAIGLLSFNAFAQDLAENHAQICAGSKEPCKVVFSVVTKPFSGMCTGKLKGTTSCSISYMIGANSGVRVLCSEGLVRVKDEMVGVAAQSYNVSALISKIEKKEVLINDPQLYTSIESKSISMFMARTKTSVAAQIMIKDKLNSSMLTDVKCN